MPPDLEKLAAQYGDIIAGIKIVGTGTARKIRIDLRDGSYIDFRFSSSGRYSYHWERSHIDGKLYRFDNAPHHIEVSTFPHHLHDGNEEKITDSWISSNPEQAIYQVMDFVRSRIK